MPTTKTLHDKEETGILHNKRGIRRKILTNSVIITVLLAVILMGVMTYFMSSSASSILQETLQPLAKSSAQNVEGSLHNLVDRVLLTAADGTISNPKSTKEEKQAVIEKTISGIEFVWLALYDKSGNLSQGSSGSPSTINTEELDLYDNIIETKNLAINDTVLDGDNLQILVGAPITNSKGEIVEILVGSYKYDILNDALSSINVGKNGTAFIVNEDGEIMAHKNKEKITDDASIKTEIEDSDKLAELFEQIKLGQTNSIEYSITGDDLFLSYSPVRGADWYLIILTHKSDFTSGNTKAIAISVVVTMLLLFFAIFFSANMSKRIQRPLGRVTDRITRLSDGDLHSEVVIENTKDETEALSVAVNQTVKDINSYISEFSRVLTELSNNNLDVKVKGDYRGDFVVMKDSLNKIIDFMNRIMSSIQVGSTQVLDSSRLVSNNAESVKNSSSSQSESIQMLNEETASIQDNILEVKDSSAKVAELIDEVRITLESSEEDMKNTLIAMENISANSDEITAINKLLEDISFQTNILSLNAAVEAVNAGLAGKGFAVVADEVRALAEKSSESSKQTRSMIEQTKKSIDEGSEYVDSLAETLNNVLKMIQEITDITSALTTAVATQTASLEEITSQVNNINSLASSNLSVSSTSAEASHELTQEADALKEMANNFKLRKGGKDD